MFEILENQLRYSFKDKDLLRLALAHKSHANEGRKRGEARENFVNLHNERLEFLGDSVLGLIASDLLSERFTQVDEGKLSRMRSSLVKEETLAQIARNIQLGEHILLGKGEENSQGRAKDSILASTYEAVLGAIYLDGGLAAAFETVKTHFNPYLASDEFLLLQQDTKTLLQEICQARFRQSPLYKVVAEAGPDHEKTFEVMVSIGEQKRYGKGRNKKEAEQAAAKFLLESLSGSSGEQVGHV